MEKMGFIEEIVETEVDIAVAYYNGLVGRASMDDKVTRVTRLAFALSILKKFVKKLESNKVIKEISEKVTDRMVRGVFED